MATINRSLAWLLPALLLSGSGCALPLSTHPVVDPAEAQPCPELYGVYRFESAKNKDNENREFSLWHIGPADENYPPGFLQMISLHFKDGLPHSYNGILFAEKVGDAYIVNLPEMGGNGQEFVSEAASWKPWKETWGPWKYGWDADRVKFYHLWRITLNEGNLHLAMMDPDFVVREIEAGGLSGEVTRSADAPDSPPLEVRITAETPELRSFVEQHIAGGLFLDLDNEMGHFVRIEIDRGIPGDPEETTDSDLP